jgi:mono/diheme cytochrome c family protein
MTRGKMRYAGLLALAGWLAVAGPARAGDTQLLGLMGKLQTFAHKLQLSVTARNGRLADFYLHELEETSEEIVEDIESYDGQPISRLVQDMLLPAIEAMEKPVKAGDWAGSDQGLANLLQACNACHQVTGHAFIRIAPAGGNPYAQDFSPPAD